MKLNYTELHQSCNNLRALFCEDELWKAGKIQKIYSSAKLVVLNVRIPGKTINIAIGRGSEHSGIWEVSGQIPAPYRIQKDLFLEYLRSNIRGKRIVDIAIDKKDKAFKLVFHDKSKCLFFYKAGRLHFSHIVYDNGVAICFSPWRNGVSYEVEGGADFDVFDQIGRKQLETEKNIRNNSPEFKSNVA